MSNYKNCAYPGCIGNVLIGDTDLGLCRRHAEMARFILWALSNMYVAEPKDVKEEIREDDKSVI